MQPAAEGTRTLAGNSALRAGHQGSHSATMRPKVSAFCECGAWLGSLGLEPTPELYTAHIVEVFREVKRVLRADGTLWLNLGDSYASGKGTCFNPGGGSSSLGQGRKAQGVHPLDRGNKSTLAASGLKCKDLVGIPWRVAFALQADGWYLRSDIIWEKRNPMPESVRDRPTKAHEYIFLLSKSATYYYDADAIKEPCSPDTHARYARGRGDNHKWADGGPGNQTIATNRPGSLFARPPEHVAPRDRRGRNSRMNISRDAQHPHEANGKARAPGVNPKCAAPGSGIKQNSSFSAAVKDIVPYRNKRTVWTIATKSFSGAHFATFPPALITPCILAGCPAGGVVLDPFAGAFTTSLVCQQLGRDSISIELSPAYIALGVERLEAAAGPLFPCVIQRER